VKFLKAVLHSLWTVIGAVMLTLALFMVLPLMQTISKPASSDLAVHAVDTAKLPPPPPPPPEEEPEEEEPEAPPELEEEAPPLDLSQLELALNPGFGGGLLEGDFAIKLKTAGAAENVNAIFSMSDLDQEPRVIYQPGPILNKKLRRRAPGTVYVIFIVNERGRVENPIVQKSTDPIFNKAAVAAVRQWRFEPGKRNGEAVRFRLRVPITFPKR
jgi:protein TonB